MNSDARCWQSGTGLLLAAHFFAGCAQPFVIDDSLATLPYEVDPGGRIVVEIRVNDRGPYRFAIDTAATSSFAFSRMIEELRLEPIPTITSTVYGAVANGNFPVVAIDRLLIGAEAWEDAQLTALPGETDATSTLDGILGADFLRRYSIALSVHQRTVDLFRPETIGDRSYRGWAAIRMESRYFGQSPEPLRYVRIELAGRSVPALVDLGSGTSVLNSEAARSLQLTTVKRSNQAVFSGAVGNQPLIARLSKQRVRTGTISWRNESFLIADLEIFDTLRATGTPLAILGSGLFNQRDLIVDFANDRLLVRAGMEEVDPPGE